MPIARRRLVNTTPYAASLSRNSSSAPYPTETPPRFAVPAIPPSDAESPQTTIVVVGHGRGPEPPTGARTSELGLRTDRLPRWHQHGCAGRFANPAKEAIDA